MKTTIFTMMITMILLTSCTMDVVSDATANADDIYMFQGIEYYLNQNEGDGAINLDKIQPTQIYYNKTSSTASFTVNLHSGLSEYSLFTTLNKPAYRFEIDEQTKVSVPVDIRNSQVILGEKRWNFNFSGIQKLPFEDYRTEKEYEVSPHTALTIGSGITIEKISTSFVATFVGQNSGSVVKVSGKWEGSRIVDSKIRENYTRVS